LAFSAAMNRWASVTALALPGEEGRGFFEDFSLLQQGAVLTAQAPELLSLLGGQALALAGVDVGLLDPVVQGLV